MGHKNRRDYDGAGVVGVYARLFILAVLTLSMGGMALAVTETLAVDGCTITGCSVSNYNSNTTSVGAVVPKTSDEIITFADSASTGSDTINSVVFRFRHKGDTGITGNTDFTFRSVGAATTYCTTSTANTVSDTYVELTPTGCSWTPARVDDLEVLIDNNDGGSPTNNNVYFAQIYVDYTTVTNFVPFWSANLADTPDPINSGSTLTYTGTGDEPDGENYRLTVCRTNTINDGYPGTCAASQTLCTSSATIDNTQASCTYVVTDTDIGTLTAYGFLCDSGTSTCNTTSTSTSTTVKQNLGNLNVSITSPKNLTNLTENQTFYINITIICAGLPGSSCGTVNATAQYNVSTPTPNTSITNTSGQKPLFVMATTGDWQNIPSSTGCFDITATNTWSSSVTNGSVTVVFTNTTLNYDLLASNGKGFRVYNGTCANLKGELYFAVSEGDNNKTFYYRNATNNTVLKVNTNTTVGSGQQFSFAVITTTNTTQSHYENATATFYVYSDFIAHDSNRWVNMNCTSTNTFVNGFLIMEGCSPGRAVYRSNGGLPVTPVPILFSDRSYKQNSGENGRIAWYVTSDPAGATPCTYEPAFFAGDVNLNGNPTFVSVFNFTEPGRCTDVASNLSTASTHFNRTYQWRWSPEANYQMNITQDGTKILTRNFAKAFPSDAGNNNSLFIWNRENDLGGSGYFAVDWIIAETAPDVFSTGITPASSGSSASNPLTCGVMNKDDLCSLSWLVNMSLNGKYFVDVLVNSTTYFPNITQNDTQDMIVQNVTVGGADNSCSVYGGSGNYLLSCGCELNQNTDLVGNNFTFSGAGTILLNANLTNWTKGRVESSCVVRTQPNGSILWR